METEKLTEGFYVSKGDDPTKKVIARQLYLSDLDSPDNYEIVSEEEGQAILQQINDALGLPPADESITPEDPNITE